MKIFITGVTGFIGTHLAGHLASVGHEVVGSTTSPSASTPSGVSALQVMRLGDPAGDRFRGVDALVHAAWSLDPGDEHRNVDGTLALDAAARAAGVRRIFISSHSAHSGAVTAYGRSKLVIEKALSGSASVVRPGLVIGRGGLFGRMSSLVARAPLVPYIAGAGTFPVIAVADLSAAIARILESHEDVDANLYLDQPTTLREILRGTAAAIGRRRFFLPLPYALAFAGAFMVDALRIPAGLSLENVRGLRANRGVALRSDLRRFVEEPMNLHEAIREAVSSP